jgi:hypothetical protein
MAYPGASAIPTTLAINAAGQPQQRFLKDVLIVGHYEHPTAGWTEDLDRADLDRLADTFRAMRRGGVDVECVRDHGSGAGAVVGYSLEMFRGGTPEATAVYPAASDPDRLYAVLEMRGVDSIELAGKVRNVSVLIEADYKDGKGNEYGEAITHVSLVQGPIVPGQNDFIALSREGAQKSRVPLFVHSSEAKGNSQEPQMDLAKLAKIIGVEGLTEDKALEAVEGAIKALSQDRDDLAKKVEELTAKVTELSAAAAKANSLKLDPNVAEALGRAAETRLSALVTAGKITPGCKDKLASALIGAKGKRHSIHLALSDGQESNVVDLVADALEANETAKLGAQTGPQNKAMSRDGDNADDAPDTKDIEARAKRIRRFSGVKE